MGIMLDCTPCEVPTVEGVGNQNPIPITTLNPQPSRVHSLDFKHVSVKGTSGFARLSLSSSSLSLALSRSLALSPSLFR